MQTEIKGSTKMDLEVLRKPVVQCPINGWQLQSYCERGPWRYGFDNPCPFYNGKKELIDLSGEKFTVIHCEAEKARNRAVLINNLKSMQSEIAYIDNLLVDLPESSAIEKMSWEGRRESLSAAIESINKSLGADDNQNLNGNDNTGGNLK